MPQRKSHLLLFAAINGHRGLWLKFSPQLKTAGGPGFSELTTPRV